MARSLVEHVEEISATRKTALGRRKPKLDNACQLRGIYCFDLEDMDFNETMNNARKKLELQIDSAMQ